MTHPERHARVGLHENVFDRYLVRAVLGYDGPESFVYVLQLLVEG